MGLALAAAGLACGDDKMTTGFSGSATATGTSAGSEGSTGTSSTTEVVTGSASGTETGTSSQGTSTSSTGSTSDPTGGPKFDVGVGGDAGKVDCLNMCGTATFSYIWISNSTESTVSKINTRTLVEDLMGRKPEKRYAFIQEHAKFARDLDV